MLENQRWKEATEGISEVVKDHSIKFPKSTTELTGFWSVSNAEALMWLGQKTSARQETRLVDRYRIKNKTTLTKTKSHSLQPKKLVVFTHK
jgi:hypothetical protein